MSINVKPLLPNSVDNSLQSNSTTIYNNLRKLSYFSKVSNTILWEISGFVTSKTFQAQTVVYEKGDPGDSIFFIIKGEVEVLSTEGTTIAVLREGNYFGEIALIQNSKRMNTIKTSQQTLFYCIDENTFMNTLMDESSFRMKLLKELTARIRNATEELQLRSSIGPQEKSSSPVSFFSQIKSIKMEKFFSKPKKKEYAAISLKFKDMKFKDIYTIFGSIPPNKFPAILIENSTWGTGGADLLLFKQGDSGDAIYIILEGSVSICTDTDGTPKEITKSTEGTIFGIMAMFGSPRSASAIIGPDGATLLRMVKKTFLDFFKDNNEYSKSLVKHFVKLLQEADKKEELALINREVDKKSKKQLHPTLFKRSSKDIFERGVFFDVQKPLGHDIEYPIQQIGIEQVFSSIACKEASFVIPRVITINGEQFWPLPNTKEQIQKSKFWSIENSNAISEIISNEEKNKEGENDFRISFFINLIKSICAEGLDVNITEETIERTVNALFKSFAGSDDEPKFEEMAQSIFLNPLRLVSFGCFAHADNLMRKIFPKFFMTWVNQVKKGNIYKTLREGRSAFHFIVNEETYTVRMQVHYKTVSHPYDKPDNTTDVCEIPTVWTVGKCEKEQDGYWGQLLMYNEINWHTATDWEKKYIKECVDNLKKQTVKKVAPIPKQMASVMVPERAFGKAKWEEYIGEVGAEPPLPRNIHEILQSECLIWPGKKVEQTHILTLVPKTVNGKRLTLKTLGKLVQKPKRGYATKYYVFFPSVHENTPTSESHWVLMARDVIPNSRNKSYSNQKQLTQTYNNNGVEYEVPKLLDATVRIFMEFVRTEERLFSDDPWTYTRCQESFENKGNYQMIVGGFSASGLVVGNDGSDYESVGISFFRKFS